MRLVKYILFIIVIVLINFFIVKHFSVDKETALLEQHINEAYEDLTLLERLSNKRIEYLIIHCTYTTPETSWGKGNIFVLNLYRFFRLPKPQGRGWDRNGYHFVVTRDGVERVLTPLDDDAYLEDSEIVYGAAGYNSNSINIALEGGAAYKSGKLIDYDNFTQAQVRTMRNTIAWYKMRFPWIKVVPHSAVARKTCPVIQMNRLH